MQERSIAHRLADMAEATDHIRSVLHGVSLEDFEAGWQKRWLVERVLEIISEASRHLSDELKSHHNVLRHDYERIGPTCCGACAGRFTGSR